MDEAIHLTSAFLLAGFSHVIGTLWPINDRIAVTVADVFYATVATTTKTGDPILKFHEAAYALHHAIRTVRDAHPMHPSLWAAFIHAGV